MNIKSAVLIFCLSALFVVFFIGAFNANREIYNIELNFKERETINILNFCLQNAADEEFQFRFTLPESAFTHSFRPYTNDSTQYATKRIETMDTIFHVRIRKDDPRAYMEIHQFILKGYLPIKLEKLNTILTRCLQENNINSNQCFLEYVDLQKNKILDNTKNVKPDDCYVSDIITLDIINTIGVKAYIGKDIPSFWEAKKYEILRDIGLILLVFILFLCLIFFRKHIFKS